MSSRRKCLNHPDKFCYICGEFCLTENRLNITIFIRQAYLAYFGCMLGDQDKEWAPHIVCKGCTEHLRDWTKGKRKGLTFGVPMVWMEPQNHHDDCYFCAINLTGINRKNKKSLKYPSLPSAIRPVPHCDDIPIPLFKSLPDLSEDETVDDDAGENLDLCQGDQEDQDYENMSSELKKFNQGELNDLVRDLNLPKKSAELLASRLGEKNLLESSTKITFYRNRDSEFLPFFTEEDGLVFCCDIPGLLNKLGLKEYNPNQWRLFIDSSKYSLKVVLLHNGNVLGSIPVAHSTKLKETYEAVKLVLLKIKYEEHSWQICVDLKMVNFLLGQQGGFTKYPCFICHWDSRAREEHWEKKEWPERVEMVVGDKNVIAEPLVDRSKIIFPPLHIKLGLMKQFVKALDKEGGCFLYICDAFPGLSIEKKKAGVFDGPQIRKLINDDQFLNSMNPVESNVWSSFVLVVKNFLGTHKAENYVELVERMLESFKQLKAYMSIKVHFLFSHLDRFPSNLGSVSDEQGERFHQDMRDMEERYQGRWDVNMMADYCWSIARDHPEIKHKRRASKRSFVP